MTLIQGICIWQGLDMDERMLRPCMVQQLPSLRIFSPSYGSMCVVINVFSLP